MYVLHALQRNRYSLMCLTHCTASKSLLASFAFQSFRLTVNSMAHRDHAITIPMPACGWSTYLGKNYHLNESSCLSAWLWIIDRLDCQTAHSWKVSSSQKFLPYLDLQSPGLRFNWTVKIWRYKYHLAELRKKIGGRPIFRTPRKPKAAVHIVLLFFLGMDGIDMHYGKDISQSFKKKCTPKNNDDKNISD